MNNIYKNIHICCVDIDGVLTDGTYQISEHNDQEVTKLFYTRDFYSIEQLMKDDVKVAIISQSHDKVINTQIRRIRHHSQFWDECFMNKILLVRTGINNKKNCVESFFKGGLSWDDVAYIGDAENDLECIELAKFSGCPADAIPSMRDKAIYVSNYCGGKGAVYDFCTYIIRKREEENKR